MNERAFCDTLYITSVSVFACLLCYRLILLHTAHATSASRELYYLSAVRGPRGDLKRPLPRRKVGPGAGSGASPGGGEGKAASPAITIQLQSEIIDEFTNVPKACDIICAATNASAAIAKRW